MEINYFPVLLSVRALPARSPKGNKRKVVSGGRVTLTENFAYTPGLHVSFYIGETGRTLREHFGEHLRSINKNAHGFPVAEHFSSNGHTEEEAGDASHLSSRDMPAVRPQC